MKGMAFHKFMGVAGTIAIFLIVGLISNLTSRTKAFTTGNTVNFGPPLAIKIIAIALPSVFLFGFVLFNVLRPFEYGSLTFLVIACLGAFGLPAEIIVTPDVITEKYWWRSKKTIFWKDVRNVSYNTPSGGIQIQGADGEKITHSRVNRDRQEFARLCEKYARSA
jgi:hypothetical protein